MRKPRPPISDPAIRLSAVAVLVGLGGFLAWAVLAPLDEGIIAAGQIVVRGDRKEIAHFEGGIVREIHVVEGQAVEQGARLVTLEPVQSEAARDEIAQELFVARAAMARLDALRAGAQEPSFPDDRLGLPPEVTQAIITQQGRVFAEQRASYEAELQVLRTRRQSAESRAGDLGVQIAATSDNLRVAREDLATRREAFADQLETIGNVQRAEREVLSLEAERARQVSERNLARRSALEAGDQIAELESRFRRTIEEEAAGAAAQVLALTERLEANDDRLSRTLITSPLAGVVLGLKTNTVGGVVRPGEPIMEIVPRESRLIALLRLPPTDREAVRPGQRVVARLSAYKQYRMPRIDGEVMSVSADLREDPATGTSFYEARVVLDPATLTGIPGLELVPGLPVEAFIASGRRRTFMDHVLEPVASTVRRGLSFN